MFLNKKISRFDNRTKSSSGFSLVEVIVGLAIFSTMVATLIGSYILYFQVSVNSPNNLSAMLLAHEGVEVVRVLRDQSWENISMLENNREYYLNFQNGVWSIQEEPVLVGDIFTRVLFIEDVYRDVDDNITLVGGSPDPDTLYLRVEVFWSGVFGDSTRDISAYITNIFKDEQ